MKSVWKTCRTRSPASSPVGKWDARWCDWTEPSRQTKKAPPIGEAFCLLPTAEQRSGIVAGRLVGDREVLQPLQRVMGIAVGAHGVGVEAAAAHEEQLVAQHIANGADLAPVAVALAQQAGAGIVATVGEGGEV